MPPTSETAFFLCFLCCFFLAFLLLFIFLMSSSTILIVSASERLGRYSRLAIHSSALVSSTHRSLRTRPSPYSSSAPTIAVLPTSTTASSFPFLSSTESEKIPRLFANCMPMLETAISICDCLCLSCASSLLDSARSTSSFFRQPSNVDDGGEAARGALNLELDALLPHELPSPQPATRLTPPKTSTASLTDWNGRVLSISPRAVVAVISMNGSDGD
uniref:Uncharacterized protein n=1 Tax=Triticum urartu TaxID=4572 RepID=A0A8R7V7W9_TRIUA